ncbi:MAG: translation initiation inhibitor [Candidatus Hydrogenedentes bacterium]|nr:translation initiation inhibitor [Candidatus Hydrogenedentota bacterium]
MINKDNRTFPGGTTMMRRLPSAVGAEVFLSGVPGQGEAPEAFLANLVASLRAQEIQVAAAEVFGSLPPDALAACVPGDWPVTWVVEPPERGQAISGVLIWGIQGAVVRRLPGEGRVAGSVFEDEHALYCRCSGILPRNPDASPAEQTAEVFERMESVLAEADMNFGHVVRTWFYNRDITAWYREFNDARDEFFYARRIFDGIVPASTGMGGWNPAGAALVGGCLAVKPKTSAVQVRRLSSPLQCPAFDYGSSFSRAVEVDEPECRRILISGTASIAPEGQTLYVDDAGAQMTQTLRVVEAILTSRGMGWEHVTRAILYYKRMKDLPVFERIAAGLPAFPAIFVNNDVCRDDLLFEFELDAIEAKQTG